MVNSSDSSSIVSSITVDEVSYFHFIEVSDFVIVKVEFDGVIDFDFGIYEFNGSTVVRDQVTDFVGPDEFLFNSAKFELSLFLFERNQSESSFDVIE